MREMLVSHCKGVAQRLKMLDWCNHPGGDIFQVQNYTIVQNCTQAAFGLWLSSKLKGVRNDAVDLFWIKY